MQVCPGDLCWRFLGKGPPGTGFARTFSSLQAVLPSVVGEVPRTPLGWEHWTPHSAKPAWPREKGAEVKHQAPSRTPVCSHSLSRSSVCPQACYLYPLTSAWIPSRGPGTSPDRRLWGGCTVWQCDCVHPVFLCKPLPAFCLSTMLRGTLPHGLPIGLDYISGISNGFLKLCKCVTVRPDSFSNASVPASAIFQGGKWEGTDSLPCAELAALTLGW